MLFQLQMIKIWLHISVQRDFFSEEGAYEQVLTYWALDECGGTSEVWQPSSFV